jgi:peptide/nickel transport system ATP-binding protein
MTEPLLSVRDLTVRYPTRAGFVHAVNGFSLTATPGEIVCVIGETGSGKSSVVRSLLGLLPRGAEAAASEAVLRPAGQPPRQLLGCSARERKRMRGALIGFVPQSTRGALNPVLSVSQHFRACYAAHDVPGPRSAWADRTRSALAAVGLTDTKRVADSYPHQLSGGMAQRVVLALAAVLDPPLLVADEPTSGLDATVRRGVLEQLQRVCVEGDRTLIIVTHDLGIVGRYCQRVVVMYGGFVLESGPAAAVLSQPRHPYTRALLGAIPRRGRALVALPGSIGSLLELPSGCPFLDRCPKAGDEKAGDERCATELPPLREIGPRHHVATFCA